MRRGVFVLALMLAGGASAQQAEERLSCGGGRRPCIFAPDMEARLREMDQQTAVARAMREAVRALPPPAPPPRAPLYCTGDVVGGYANLTCR